MKTIPRSASDRLLTILQSWLECSFQNVTVACASFVWQRVVRRDEVRKKAIAASSYAEV